MESEDLLLPSDLSRIRRMVKDVYDGGVTDSDRRFLRTKFRRFKARGHENAFTEVFMDSVSQLVENYDKVIDIFTCERNERKNERQKETNTKTHY